MSNGILLVTPVAYYSLRAFSGYVADSRTNAWDLDMTEQEDPAQSRRYCMQYLLLFHVGRMAFWKNYQKNKRMKPICPFKGIHGSSKGRTLFVLMI